ncbi:MAG: dynamin family protein [Planctomycetes bacterium]|nr:dynamin family protein [Planctomycetota bacterium]
MSAYDEEKFDEFLDGESGPDGQAGQDATADLTSPRDDRAGDAGNGQPDRQGESFRTLLGDFARHFADEFGPLLVPLRGAIATIENAPDDLPVRRLLPDLRQLDGQARELVQKIESQQACVLIFGPLKSGKSTFMNALCASYVSEVTSLPAYPCLVKVRHGREPAFNTTAYDGSTKSFYSHEQLRQAVDLGYENLSAAIRQAEADGRDFDPAGDMPQAIRQIDITLPLDILARSGASLVDTPGLYTRMKFSYDRLTKDFRNTAACAIFIVKTDNLFLEQVFEEFNELLGLFGRIFLVVNLDGSKKDLRPDGALAASLEHDEPRRIVEAFRVLTMSEPLKNAADHDKLRIYPVDLLHAASRRIRKSLSGGASPIAEAFDEPRGQANFDALLDDLAEYLNSSRYIVEFIETSLHGATDLAERLALATDHPAMKELDGHIRILRQELDLLATRSQALSRLKGLDWASFGSASCQAMLAKNQNQAAQLREIASRALTGAIDNWFLADASLSKLNADSIAPLLAQTRDSMSQTASGALKDCTSVANCGLDVSEGIMGDLELCEIELPALADRIVGEIGQCDQPQNPTWQFSAEEIPVRKRFWDWLLFRGRAKIRKIVFGPPDKTDKPIPPKVKAGRLGRQAKQIMAEMAEHKLGEIILSCASASAKEMFEAYFNRMAALLVDTLDRKEQQTARRLADLEKRLAAAEESFNARNHIRDEAQNTIRSMQSLMDKFVAQPGSPGQAPAWPAPTSSAWAVPSEDGGLERPEPRESANNWQIPPGDWPADDDESGNKSENEIPK